MNYSLEALSCFFFLMPTIIVHCNNLSFSCGYHRAYTELFNLVENRRKARVEQGPGGPLSQGFGQTIKFCRKFYISLKFDVFEISF